MRLGGSRGIGRGGSFGLSGISAGMPVGDLSIGGSRVWQTAQTLARSVDE